jgi:predicted AAA+ superfamily ATPase
MLTRNIIKSINELKKQFPIVAITGPRQSGKTTLLKEAFPGYEYISLENPDILEYANRDTKGFLEVFNNHVIFDEAQRCPKLFSYLQTKVDSRKEMGQFVLSGSQNFHLMQSITQSLSGRVALFKLLPFDFQELKNGNLFPKTYQEAIYKGFYPAIYDRNIKPQNYHNSYIQTYVERDISDVLQVRDIKQFRDFVKICAGRVGQILNINSLAKDCGISQPTAKSWLSLLENSYIVFLLQPFYNNFNKRVLKTPKLYFYDTGLASFLLGIRSAKDVDSHTMKGGLFENLIIAELVKQNHHYYQLKEYWYWRDSNGNEIDLLCENKEKHDIFEIKATKTIMSDLFKGLDHFESTAGKEFVKNKILAYGGEENQKRTKYTIKSWSQV